MCNRPIHEFFCGGVALEGLKTMKQFVYDSSEYSAMNCHITYMVKSAMVSAIMVRPAN